MTICEVFRNGYLKFKENEIEERAKIGTGKYARYQIRPEIEVGTKLFVEVFFKTWDMYYDYQLKDMGITEQQLSKACENGFIQKKEWSNWQARQRGQTRGFRITNKGIKALYKAYEGQW
jgi:hypothetical protein